MSKKESEINSAKVQALVEVMEKAGIELNAELEKVELPEESEVTASNTAEDIAARYWLMQFLEPLSRKELKSIIDGFLVQLLNEAQAKKLVRFLMTRFPQYYKKTPEEEGSFKPKRPS